MRNERNAWIRSSLAAALLVLVAACGSGGGEEDVTPDKTVPLPPPVTDTGNAEADAAVLPDAAREVEAEVAPPVVNTPPEADPLPPLDLDMGTSTTLDVGPFISDKEDPASALALSWSAEHVALADSGTHVLLVVAPTDWFGAEVIDITVTDTGGLTALTSLKVVVQEVEEPEPEPVPCGTTEFTLDAGKEAQQVLLSGTFNDWASTPDKAVVLEDADADGVFKAVLVLQPGTHQYKFIVDGTWMEDPANPNKVSDNMGGFNSVLVVPDCPEA